MSGETDSRRPIGRPREGRSSKTQDTSCQCYTRRARRSECGLHKERRMQRRPSKRGFGKSKKTKSGRCSTLATTQAEFKYSTDCWWSRAENDPTLGNRNMIAVTKTAEKLQNLSQKPYRGRGVA